jgi:hypothetical protein
MEWKTWAQIMLMMAWAAFLAAGLANSIKAPHRGGGKTDGR